MDSKLLFLFLLFACVLTGAVWIMNDLQSQSTQTFFGTAETDSRVVNLEFPGVVQQVFVEPGAKVRQGDTLAVLVRTEFDREALEFTGEMKQIAAELDAENRALDREQEELLDKYATQISELKTEIKVLQTESDVQENLKAALSGSEKEAGGENNIPNVRKAQIAAMEETILQLERQTREEIKQFDKQRLSNQSVHDARVSYLRRSVEYIASERDKMVLLAAIDGYVELVLVRKNQIVQGFTELFRITALQPVKVVCYLHESEADVMVPRGDTVELSSTARPEIICQGVVTGSTSRLVELPTRLRKFAEIITWGREMFIQLPETNQFYVGEKIQVVVNTAKLSKSGQIK